MVCGKVLNFGCSGETPLPCLHPIYAQFTMWIIGTCLGKPDQVSLSLVCLYCQSLSLIQDRIQAHLYLDKAYGMIQTHSIALVMMAFLGKGVSLLTAEHGLLKLLQITALPHMLQHMSITQLVHSFSEDVCIRTLISFMV